MAVIFYNIFLLLYRAGIRIAALRNKKARLWIHGRKNFFERLNSELRTQNSPLIWFHCSSLGEFEQGRPVIEKLKAQGTGHKILLTFFSPSGYEIRKDYQGADWVFYLPVDSRANAKKFFDIVNPSLAVFVKYDYWYYYLTECKKRNIPLLMISAIFRKDQLFFKWYGGLHRKMLRCFAHFFVQEEGSKELLQRLEINKVTVAGDTRFDRVIAIAEKFEPLPEIEKFCGNSKVLVAGSTWPDDERVIKEAIVSAPDLKLIIAPHEIHKGHLDEIRKLFPESLLYSQLSTSPSDRVIRAGNVQPAYRTGRHPTSGILIIDNIGILSKLYHYATIAYVGGGFNNGIHNILEAAVYMKPVIFGPRYQKFREAIELIRSGGGISIASYGELKDCLLKLLADTDLYKMSCNASLNYVRGNKGATEKIIRYIQENRLLTS